MTFSELKQKDVINVREGRRLGKPIDIVLGTNACVEAIVVPGPCGFWQMLAVDREGYAIPWQSIRCIGDDVVLVDLEKDFFGGACK